MATSILNWVKTTFGAGAVDATTVRTVTASDDPLLTAYTVTSATLANVASSASSVTIFASNAAAKGRQIENDSASATLKLKFGATASATSYTVTLGPGAYFEFPNSPLYTGVVDGIWSAAVGSARTTET